MQNLILHNFVKLCINSSHCASYVCVKRRTNDWTDMVRHVLFKVYFICCCICFALVFAVPRKEREGNKVLRRREGRESLRSSSSQSHVKSFVYISTRTNVNWRRTVERTDRHGTWNSPLATRHCKFPILKNRTKSFCNNFPLQKAANNPCLSLFPFSAPSLSLSLLQPLFQ